MAEWTSKKREELYKYLAAGELKKAIDLVAPMTALKQSDFSPRDKKAVNAFTQKVHGDEKLQHDLVKMVIHQSKAVKRLGQYCFKFFSEFPAPPLKKVMKMLVELTEEEVNANKALFQSTLVDHFKNEFQWDDERISKVMEGREPSYTIGLSHGDSIKSLLKVMELFPTNEIDEIIQEFTNVLIMTHRREFQHYQEVREKYLQKKEHSKKQSQAKNIQKSENDPLSTALKDFTDTGDFSFIKGYLTANPNLTSKKLNLAKNLYYSSAVEKLAANTDAITQLTTLLFEKNKTGSTLAHELLTQITKLPYDVLLKEFNRLQINYQNRWTPTPTDLRPIKNFVAVYFHKLTIEAFTSLEYFDNDYEFFKQAAEYLVGDNLSKAENTIKFYIDQVTNLDTKKKCEHISNKLPEAYRKLHPRFAAAEVYQWRRYSLKKSYDEKVWGNFYGKNRNFIFETNTVPIPDEDIESRIHYYRVKIQEIIDGKDQETHYHQFYNTCESIRESAKEFQDIHILEKEIWPSIEPFFKALQLGIGDRIQGDDISFYLILSPTPNTDYTKLLKYYLDNSSAKELYSMINRIFQSLIYWNVYKDWWVDIFSLINQSIITVDDPDIFSRLLTLWCDVLNYLCRYDIKLVKSLLHGFSHLPGFGIDEEDPYDGIRELEKTHLLKPGTTDCIRWFFLHIYDDYYLKRMAGDQHHKFWHPELLKKIDKIAPDCLLKYLSGWTPSQRGYFPSKESSHYTDYIDRKELQPIIGARVIECLRDPEYRIHSWGAQMICQYPDLIRNQGEDCLDLLSLGLWRTKNVEVRDAVYRIHFFAEVAHCTATEAIATLELVYDTDNTAAWNHATKSIKELLKMDKEATISNPDRLNEIIEIDSKYQKAFAPLLKRTDNYNPGN